MSRQSLIPQWLRISYRQLRYFDMYGNGRLSVYASLYVYCILSALNVINLSFTDQQAFFFVVPAVAAVGAAHANNVNSFQQRDNTFKMLMIFLAIGVFGFTVTEYSTLVILVFAFLFYVGLMMLTATQAFSAYRGLIPSAFVISFLTILLGGVGQYSIALNRVFTLTVAGVAGYLSLQFIPARYYHKIWYNAVYVVLTRICQQLEEISSLSPSITFHGECINRMSNSLGYTLKSVNCNLFVECTSKVSQLYCGCAFLYNSREYYARNSSAILFLQQLKVILPFFKDKQPIPLSLKLQILEHKEQESGALKNLWDLLTIVIYEWEMLCQPNN